MKRKAVTNLKVIGTTKVTGTKITFKPDPYFEEVIYDFKIISKRLLELSF